MTTLAICLAAIATMMFVANIHLDKKYRDALERGNEWALVASSRTIDAAEFNHVKAVCFHGTAEECQIAVRRAK